MRRLPETKAREWEEVMPHATAAARALLRKLLVFDQSKRLTAAEALQDAYVSRTSRSLCALPAVRALPAHPCAPFPQVMVIVVIAVGSTIYRGLITNVTSIALSLVQPTSLLRLQLECVTRYVRKRKLPDALAARALKHVEAVVRRQVTGAAATWGRATLPRPT